jgi:uncharacterized protein (DUF2249 family)
MLNSPNIPEIDIRQIAPGDRQSTIFGVLAALAPGGAMRVTSDHDPWPLRQQIEASYSDAVGWFELERGPHVWRVQISRPGSRD